MRLRNHFVYKLLALKNKPVVLAVSAVRNDVRFHQHTFDQIRTSTPDTELGKHFAFQMEVFSSHGNNNVLVTNTVLDKLDLLKVRRQENGEFDWTVFYGIPEQKKTFIFNDDITLRAVLQDEILVLAHITRHGEYENGDDDITMTEFWVRLDEPRYSRNSSSPEVRRIDEFIYKLLCFIYLSDIEETVLRPGDKQGTKRSGKVINELPAQLTIVNSNWNITSVRTEGFNVSGHIRVQRVGSGRNSTKLVWIDPFRKHGYVRRAGKERDQNGSS